MKIRLTAVLLTIIMCISGCGMKKETQEKVRDIDFTVVESEDIPGELKKVIEEQKDEEFRMTYGTKEYLYICVGYGEKETGGYSISVDELYLTKDAIYIDTNLLGPKKDEVVSKDKSTPYIVVKIEYCDNTVMFK